MNHRSPRSLFPPIALGLAFLLFLLPLPQEWTSGWRGGLTNRVHAPVMGVCFLLLATMLRHHFSKLSTLLAASLGTVILAVLVEGVQPWFGRTASLEDLVWGMAGMMGGLGWHLAQWWTSDVLRLGTRLLSLACMLSPPLFWWGHMSLIQAEASRMLPVLLNGTHLHLHQLWSIDSLGISNKPAPLVLARDATHPASIHLDTLERDWSCYAGLEISGSLEADKAVEIGVRVDLDDGPSNRLRAGGWMQPGTGQIRVFWPRGAVTPHVHQLVVFLAAHPDQARLRLQELRLIPKAASAPDSAPATSISAPATTKKTPSAGLQGTGTVQ